MFKSRIIITFFNNSILLLGVTISSISKSPLIVSTDELLIIYEEAYKIFLKFNLLSELFILIKGYVRLIAFTYVIIHNLNEFIDFINLL